MNPTYFDSPARFRRWLRQHGGSAQQLWVGYHKVGTDMPSVTWPQSVDQALCFGWIDGVRKSIDARRYMIRFTPRKSGSIWSAVNIKRAQQLIDEGLMQPAGLRAFELRSENRSGIYSYEQRPADLPQPYRKLLHSNRVAHGYFTAQPPSYRRAAIWWVVQARQETTRQRRLAQLIADCAAGRRIKQFTALKTTIAATPHTPPRRSHRRS